jgi:hypothetical protein
MLHLAQVLERNSTGQAKLQMLAYQDSEYTWALQPAENDILFAETNEYDAGMLVLIELSSTGQVKQIQDAKAWVLALIEQYLTTGVTPMDLQEEEKRAEQWRQSLTLQSQELGRRALEMEARRDQFQELEENLKREKEQLEVKATQLAAMETKLNQDSNQSN